MPFAGYADFAACVRQNQQAKDPNAYCASIKRAVEGKSTEYQDIFVKALEGEDTGWLDVREWHNDRTHTAFINDALTDFEGDRVTLDAQVLAMPHYAKEGFLEWMHGRDDEDPTNLAKKGPPIKIGRPIAWRVKDQKVEVRWGVYDRDDMMGLEDIDEKWAEIQQGGTFSMTFVPVTQYLVEEGGHRVREISLIHLQSVGFVGPWAASPGAVSTGKTSMIVMKAIDPGAVSRETSSVPPHTHASPTEGGLVETLKSGSGYARDELPAMGADEEKKAAEEQAAKIKELEAELAKAAEQAVHEKQPPEEGCPDGMTWDADAGECVPEEEMTEDSLKKELAAIRKELIEVRNLQKNRIKEGLPDPGKMKALREAIAKKLVDDEVPDETGAAILGALDAALPAAVPTPVEMSFDERVKGLVEGIVDVQMASVNQAQEKAFADYEAGIRDQLHMPVNRSRVKPAVTAAGALSLTPEKAAERLTKKARDTTQKRRTGVRGGI